MNARRSSFVLAVCHWSFHLLRLHSTDASELSDAPLSNATGSSSSSPAPSSWYLYFDGQNDFVYFRDPVQLHAVSVWLFLYPEQPTAEHFLVDSKNSSLNAHVSNSAVGTLWNVVYVDGVDLYPNVGLQSIPTNRWVHVHLAAAKLFSTSLTLMAGYIGHGHLRGRIAELYFWEQAYSFTTVRGISEGFDFTQYNYLEEFGLVSYYPCNEGTGNAIYDLTGREAYGGLVNGPTWLEYNTTASPPWGWRAASIVPSPPPPPPYSPPSPPLPPSQPSSPPGPPTSYWTVRSDGLQGGLMLPFIQEIRGIGFWIFVFSSQTDRGTHIHDRLVLSLDSMPNGTISERSFGPLWETLYVNGEPQTLSWESVPKGVWTSVHLVARQSFNASTFLLGARSTAAEAGFLRALLFEVSLWSTDVLFCSLLNDVLEGSEHCAKPAKFTPRYHNFMRERGMIALYELQEGRGLTLKDVNHYQLDGALTINGTTWEEVVSTHDNIISLVAFPPFP
ncbi:hypothetical protein CYMTET_55782 [Cymbomonas tetramitiformis]|uniref:Uncharacterized protein n=1 Tax=Cymbomonas tetramitiformis TaxID=36881 RepID=A0AAE0EMG8_9CHLO|nr:hypothetical protein CYMTET_55782 [Cymbomonas tetramitiformis]